ncbi:MAG: hypothetical protein HY331_18275 [Chloroflexi bacterium]|nr:hypothetical protein [Chloroflexota bacterium]
MRAGEDALLHEGLAALEMGDEETAHKRFVRATEVAPNSSRAWFWRAKTAPSLAEVIRSLERASAIDPANEKVRLSLAHAVDRLERAQASRRFAQPLSPEENAAPVRAERPVARLEVVPTGDRPAVRRRRPATPGSLADAMRQLAGLACLGLATLWLAVAFLPLARAIAGAPVAAVPREIARLASAYVGAAAGRLAIIPVESVGAVLGLEGGSVEMSLAVPFVLGFLYLFAASGIFQRDPSARFWAPTLALLQVGMGFLSGSRDALALAVALGVAVALGLLADRPPTDSGQPSAVSGQPSVL